MHYNKRNKNNIKSQKLFYDDFIQIKNKILVSKIIYILKNYWKKYNTLDINISLIRDNFQKKN